MANILKSLMNTIFKKNNKLKSECKMENMETNNNFDCPHFMIKADQCSICTKNYRFKIDWNKWKAALDAIHAEREADRAKTEKKFWASLDYYYDEKLTMLYSIRAQARGRLHRQFARLNQAEWKKLPSSKVKEIGYDLFTQSDGAIKFPLTLEDQAAYIGSSWKEYEKEANDISNEQRG